MIPVKNILSVFAMAIMFFLHWRIWIPPYQIIAKIDGIFNFIVLSFFQIPFPIISDVVISI